jgi:hypothetical protein
VITVNLHKAKRIAHELRRAARAAEFAPFDEVIARRIPGADDAAAEAARASIRAKYVGVQAAVDAAADAPALVQIVNGFQAPVLD